MRKLSTVFTTSGAFLLGSTILCSSGTALAQQSDMNDDRDIVVTASKREQNLQDVPLAITAIGTERLDELQVKEFQVVVRSEKRRVGKELGSTVRSRGSP